MLERRHHDLVVELDPGPVVEAALDAHAVGPFVLALSVGLSIGESRASLGVLALILAPAANSDVAEVVAAVESAAVAQDGVQLVQVRVLGRLVPLLRLLLLKQGRRLRRVRLLGGGGLGVRVVRRGRLREQVAVRVLQYLVEVERVAELARRVDLDHLP